MYGDRHCMESIGCTGRRNLHARPSHPGIFHEWVRQHDFIHGLTGLPFYDTFVDNHGRVHSPSQQQQIYKDHVFLSSNGSLTCTIPFVYFCNADLGIPEYVGRSPSSEFRNKTGTLRPTYLTFCVCPVLPVINSRAFVLCAELGTGLRGNVFTVRFIMSIWPGDI